MDDVAIGQNKTIGCEDETRATATHLLGKAKIGDLFSSRPLTNINIHDRWADLLCRMDDGLRVGVQKIIISKRGGIRSSYSSDLDFIIL